MKAVREVQLYHGHTYEANVMHVCVGYRRYLLFRVVLVDAGTHEQEVVVGDGVHSCVCVGRLDRVCRVEAYPGQGIKTE